MKGESGAMPEPKIAQIDDHRHDQHGDDDDARRGTRMRGASGPRLGFVGARS